jgi:hypothetical protein
MKASDITTTGFYWYVEDGYSTIVKAIDCFRDCHMEFAYCGDEITYDADAMPGDFIGPLEPPA